MKTATPKTPAKAAPKPAAKPAKAATTKTAPKASAKSAAKSAKPSTKPASNNREMTLARVEAVRLAQRQEGHFDCFARAVDGYCDQGGCAYHAECLSVSRVVHGL